MKVTCDREKLLAAFQTAAAWPRPAAPSRSCRTSSWRWPRTGDPHGHRPGGRHPHRRAGGRRAGRRRGVLPIARFGSILRESSDERLRIETDGRRPRSSAASGASFSLPAENPDEFPAVAEFNETRYHELPARLLQGIDPPHGLCHRQREQPLRPGRRAAGIDGRQDHGRGHRRPPPGQDGRAGQERRRARSRATP